MMIPPLHHSSVVDLYKFFFMIFVFNSTPPFPASHVARWRMRKAWLSITVFWLDGLVAPPVHHQASFHCLLCPAVFFPPVTRHLRRTGTPSYCTLGKNNTIRFSISAFQYCPSQSVSQSDPAQAVGKVLVGGVGGGRGLCALFFCCCFFVREHINIYIYI